MASTDSRPPAFTIDTRLDALERDNNRLRVQVRRVRLVLAMAVGLATLVAIVLGMMALAQAVTPIDPLPPIPKLSGFWLTDDAGELRATLFIDAKTQTPMWTLFDAKGDAWTKVDLGGGMRPIKGSKN